MTSTQKQIITHLLNEGNIAHLGVSGIRLRDKDGNPVIKVSGRTFFRLREFLRKSRSVWVINKREINKLHGKSWIKKEYKRIKNNNQNK